AIRFFADVAAGLHHLHERQLVHRDIKPANIMVTPEGAAKILDLGLALARDEPLPEDIRIAGGKGYIVGTMDYIAPEQARDATAVDHRADLYALGCTMYFALAGTPPFPGGSKKDKIRWQRLVEPLPLRQLNPAVPVPLAELIHQLMAKRPQQRPSSAEAVRSQLLSFSSGSRTALSVPAISFQEAVATYRGGETTATDWWGESSEDTPVTRSNSHPQIILPPPPPTEPVMPAVPPHRLPPQLPLSWSILWLTFLLVGGVLLVMCVLLLIRSL
ncbi:MAG: serine/threonine protein kinase, partial [Gemmataceae bacterium]|nr:serine/threonine protein kinase [Gemmataceae bacterium]